MAMIRRYCVLCRAQIIDIIGVVAYVSYPATMILNTCIIQDTRISIKQSTDIHQQKIQEQPLQMISRPETDKVQSILDARNPHPRSIARCTPSSICGLEEADRLSYVDAIRDNTIRILMIKDEAEEYMCVF
eukprot:303703_1